MLRMELCLAPRRIRVNHLFPNTSILLILYAQTIILEEVSAKVPYKPTLNQFISELNTIIFAFVTFYGMFYLYKNNKNVSPVELTFCSAGNLFRIRSAFAYGAKRLGKLLECPKENLVIELNQFFTNTWIRYGSGSRPDVPTQSLVDVQPMKVVPTVVSNSHKSVTAFKKKVESPKLLANQNNLHADQDNLTGVCHSYPDPSSQSIQKSDLHCHALPTTVNPSISHAQHQKVYAAQGNAKVSEQLERKPTEADDGPRNMMLVPISNEASEILAGPDSFPTQSRTSQVENGVDPTQTGISNPVFAPFLIGSPQQRQADSSGLTVPTGPPVPFVVLPYASRNSDGCGPQFERSEGIDQLSANIAGQSFSLLNDVDQPDSYATSIASCSTMTEPSREHNPDLEQ